MKKLASALLLLIMLLSFMVSCNKEEQEPEKSPQEILLQITDQKERAKRLSDYSDEKTEKYTSYKTEMTLEMETTIQSVSIIGEGKIEQYYSKIGTDDFCYYSIDTTTTKLASMSSALAEQKRIQYFKDGVYYLTYEDSDLENPQKIKTEMYAEDFAEYIKGDESAFDINDCTTVSCVLNQDYTWTVKYEGYTKKAISAMLKELDSAEEMFNADVIDIMVTVVTDRDLNMMSQVVEFVFAEKAKQPKFKASMTVSGIDTTEPKNALIDGFAEVDDIIILEEIEDKIKEIENDEYGAFTLELSQTTKIGATTQITKETDDVRYGYKEGQYFYDIKAELSDTEYQISYQNGYQTVKVGTQSKKAVQSDDEAMAFVNGLINNSSYDKNRMSKVKKNADGSCVITTTEPDLKAYDSLIKSMKLAVETSEQTFTITFKDDGSIASIDVTLMVKGKSTANGYASLISVRSQFKVK